MKIQTWTDFAAGPSKVWDFIKLSKGPSEQGEIKVKGKICLLILEKYASATTTITLIINTT